MNAYARAFDPHSSYSPPRSSEEYRIQMSLNYEGIGASLQVVDDYVTIMNVLEAPGGGSRHAQHQRPHSSVSARDTRAPSPTSSAGGWMMWCS